MQYKTSAQNIHKVTKRTQMMSVEFIGERVQRYQPSYPIEFEDSDTPFGTVFGSKFRTKSPIT